MKTYSYLVVAIILTLIIVLESEASRNRRSSCRSNNQCRKTGKCIRKPNYFCGLGSKSYQGGRKQIFYGGAIVKSEKWIFKNSQNLLVPPLPPQLRPPALGVNSCVQMHNFLCFFPRKNMKKDCLEYRYVYVMIWHHLPLNLIIRFVSNEFWY